MQVSYKGQQVTVSLRHRRFTEPKDAYTDSYVDDATWPDGRELTDEERDELTEQLQEDGTMLDDWRETLCSIFDV